MSVWVNNSKVSQGVAVPPVQRWTQPINLAANAYLEMLKVGGGRSKGGCCNTVTAVTAR